ncbi:hypothetical protein MTO96_021128 [Rhipicephalus appendiculatus]
MAAAADLKMESAKTVDVHLFSCDIKHRGKAKASTYFLPHVEPVDGQPGIFKSHLPGTTSEGPSPDATRGLQRHRSSQRCHGLGLRVQHEETLRQRPFRQDNRLELEHSALRRQVPAD